MNFIYALLITYGISLIIVHGTIFRGSKALIKGLPITNKFLDFFRTKFLEMVNCMLCVSFWIGAIVGGYFEILPWYNIFLNGGLFTATTWILHCLMSFLGNGYDPGRVFNLNVTEPIKFEQVGKKEEPINKDDALQIFKG
jgi:hypothetical protein